MHRVLFLEVRVRQTAGGVLTGTTMFIHMVMSRVELQVKINNIMRLDYFVGKDLVICIFVEYCNDWQVQRQVVSTTTSVSIEYGVRWLLNSVSIKYGVR